MRLCAHDFYPATSTIINSDEQTILFHITSSYVAHILDTIPVDDVISLMAHVASYRKIEQANKGNVFYQLKHNQVAHTGVAHWQFRCNEFVCELDVTRSIPPGFNRVPCLAAGVGHLGL